MSENSREWVNWAIRRIESDFQRSADTHLIKVDLPALPGIDLYLKDESTHPSGSLKHRLARSLFLYGLANGWIEEGTPIIESSSGNTAVSEAYFARLLGLPFIAVMPRDTSERKVREIEFYGGECRMVDGHAIYSAAAEIARSVGGHYLDQFTNAERVTDWRGNNNIAQSIFEQMQRERFPIPDWIVVSAGTGGTPATIGRYIRYRCHDTRLCVADPENSVFYDYWRTRDCDLTSEHMSVIEGIGRPRVEPSFVPDVIDHMIRVPDAASIATIHFLEKILGRKAGGSTGTNLYACFQLIQRLVAEGREASLVTMLCDTGDRYLNTFYNEDWLGEKGFVLAPWLECLEHLYATGRFKQPAAA
ncbi:PLP-dependent cysteine synthase family protein [Wenzhouxiangella limi]|uniref:L-cysteine desulfhydrase Cds1 n=1 Tax=Wenzhouxiangella limi TaxID=2707351 RepID=A0A845UZS8_9GAMM|nr:PLP-dependent cysteine synthase family protein [Wenzhouxiangella limi]NDY96877.1 PLP-dependent cysteine synthase family protein [Wenzhouxiangella limi]